MFESLAEKITSAAAKISFDALIWLIWGSFIAIFVLALTLCLCLPYMRASSKRPYLCLLYAYTALTLAAFLTKNKVEHAAFVACIFWVAGYLGYGILCLASREKKRPARTLPEQVAACAAPAQTVKAVQPAPVEPPAQSKVKTVSVNAVAHNNVRLEHAIAVTDKLLEKNLGKTDRQELEKLKNTLEVLRIKGTMTPAEGEILNENFNTLLKLMAKYNV